MSTFWTAAVLVAAAATELAAASPATLTTSSAATGLEGIVHRISTEHGVDPRLADALVRVESGYAPAAVSRRGALGLMQLMPDTARRLEVDDPFDPEDNVRGGVQEMARLLERYAGDLPLVLAAYNAGEGAVDRFGGVPPFAETRSYVSRVMSLYTGRPYRVPETRAVPVRMHRDEGGRVVISNLPRTGIGPTPTETVAIAARPLGGGFGVR
jgi:soluble lytic murein transglycosylase-like protein